MKSAKRQKMLEEAIEKGPWPSIQQLLSSHPDFWTLVCKRSFVKSTYLLVNPFSYLNIHVSEQPVSLDFQSVRQVILHLASIKNVWWPSKSVEHDNCKQRPCQLRHQANTSNSNFGKIPTGLRNILIEMFDPLHKF